MRIQRLILVVLITILAVASLVGKRQSSSSARLVYADKTSDVERIPLNGDDHLPIGWTTQGDFPYYDATGSAQRIVGRRGPDSKMRYEAPEHAPTISSNPGLVNSVFVVGHGTDQFDKSFVQVTWNYSKGKYFNIYGHSGILVG